jgi:hypothetical protein
MHYAIKTYGIVDSYFHVFLTSAVVGDQRSASRPCRFTSQEKAHRYSLNRTLGDLRTGLDHVEE